MLRTFAVVSLLVFAGVMTFAANTVVWADRTALTTDQFVSTVEPVLTDEQVQQSISVALANELYTRTDLEVRIREGLPEGLAFLAEPIAIASRQFIANATLRILQSERYDATRQDVLRGVHSKVVALIENDRDLLNVEGNSLVLDLRPVLMDVTQDIGSGRASGLLARLDIPPDAGRIVLVENTTHNPAPISIMRKFVEHRRQINIALVGTAAAAFALAVVVARDRRATLRTAGYVLICIGAVILITLIPTREILVGLTKRPHFAGLVFDSLMREYKTQWLVTIAVGAVTAGGAALAGPSDAAVAMRSLFRGRAGREGEPGFDARLRAAAPALRLIGIVAAVLVLTAWPSPSARVYVTTIVLLALYLVLLAVMSSDAQWAVSAREQGETLRRRYFAPSERGAPSGPPKGWIAGHAGLLRGLGIGVAILALLFSPTVTLGTFAVVATLTLLYLGAVEWLASRPRSRA